MPKGEVTRRNVESTQVPNETKIHTSEKQPEVDKFAEFVHWATYSLPPNIKTFSLKHYANFLKATILPYMLFLMWYFKNYSLGCWVYMAIHGAYGFLWNLKTIAFPDKSHEERVSIGSLPQLFLVISGYWYIPYMMASGQSEQNPSAERIFWSVLVFVIGASFMMITDCQKYFCLMHKKALIDYGMFAHCRNPNYLGEMMLYASFAILSNRTTPWVILISIWTCIFSILIYVKERSFRRKAGWEQYRKKSYLLIPKLYGSDLLSIIVYGSALVIGIKIYNMGGMLEVLKLLNQ